MAKSCKFKEFVCQFLFVLNSELPVCSPIEEIRLGRSVMAGNQELAVMSQTDLTCIEGLSLYVALKAAKSQV